MQETRNPATVTYSVRPEVKELVTILANKYSLYLSQVIELAVLSLAQRDGFSKEVAEVNAS
jgi:hypothetical protein